jgi:uncharacterized OB-fold protein
MIRDALDQTFWDHIAMGSLALQHCRLCDHVWFPPGPGCPNCGAGGWSWRAVSGRGSIVSWATFRRTYFAEQPAPYTVIVAQLTEGPLIVADTPADPATLSLGLPVRLRFDQFVDPNGKPQLLYRWVIG